MLRKSTLRDWDSLLALGAMLVAGLLLTLAQYLWLDHQLHDELNTQATMLAQMSQAAVVFSDSIEVRELLQTLRAHPSVQHARVLAANGTPFASYQRDPAEPRAGAPWPQPTVTADIVVNGRAIGSVELVARTRPLWTQLAAFAAASASIMLTALWLVSWASRRMRADVRAAQERQRYLASHDALTGLANRDAFNMHLLDATRRATAEAPGFALVFIDLDNFKRINDTYGHPGGDALLCTVATRLREKVRASDVVARVGGDEFAVLLHAVDDTQAIRRIVGAMLAAVAQPFDFHGEPVSASASAGIALHPVDGQGSEALLQAADAAMYQAKRIGKNAYEFYSTRIAGDQAEQRLIERDLRAALAHGGELWLAYQPVFDSASQVVALEALVRWNHPTRGTVAPGLFVPVAEACALMPQLGLAILDVVAADIAHWKQRGVPVPRIAVNLSSRQFLHERDQAAFLRALDHHRLEPDAVSFELTESAIFEDLSSPTSIIAALQARRYRLALDDFGTGYSSLAYLLRLRCDTLKVDRMFVQGASRSKESSLLVAAMVQVAHSLGMTVIAEGVETEADLHQVRSLGCDAVQGYLLSRPVDRDRIEALLAPVPV